MLQLSGFYCRRLLRVVCAQSPFKFVDSRSTGAMSPSSGSASVSALTLDHPYPKRREIYK